MAPRQCAKCRALFNYVQGDPLCPNCKEQLEKDFKIVRKFLRQYPNSTIEQTEEATSVLSKYIVKFIRDGRLELAKDSPIGIGCQRCGKNIHVGHYCKECEQEIRKEFNTNLNSASKTSQGRAQENKNNGPQYLNKRGF